MQKQGGSYETDKKGKSKLIERTKDADNGEKLEQQEGQVMTIFQDSKTAQPQGCPKGDAQGRAS